MNQSPSNRRSKTTFEKLTAFTVTRSVVIGVLISSRSNSANLRSYASSSLKHTYGISVAAPNSRRVAIPRRPQCFQRLNQAPSISIATRAKKIQVTLTVVYFAKTPRVEPRTIITKLISNCHRFMDYIATMTQHYRIQATSRSS